MGDHLPKVLYKEKGYAQKIVRSGTFELVTLAVIRFLFVIYVHAHVCRVCMRTDIAGLLLVDQHPQQGVSSCSGVGLWYSSTQALSVDRDVDASVVAGMVVAEAEASEKISSYVVLFRNQKRDEGKEERTNAGR